MKNHTFAINRLTDNLARASLVILLPTLLTLSACALSPTEPEVFESPQEIEQSAEAAQEKGDHRRAAELFEEAAKAYEEPPAQARARLKAAQAWMDGEALDSAASSIAGVNPKLLDEAIAPRFWLIRARVLLNHGQSEAASQQLDFLYGEKAGIEREYYTLRAKIAKQKNEHINQARYLIAREEYIDKAAERESNREKIWGAMNEIPSQVLEEIETDNELLAGWIELALISRRHRLDPPQLEQAIEEWKQEYPDHPAAQNKAAELIGQLQERYKLPQHIALLLPLSGEFAAAGQAIREGVISAYYSSDFARPRIEIYNTAGKPDQIVKAYNKAVERGAEHIIGPLTKEKLATLIDKVDSLEIPLLALNTIEGQAALPDGVVQFGLSPENEAKQAAIQARQRGWETVISLTPNDSWGERVKGAFTKAFQSTGGVVAETATYDPNGTDFSKPIKGLLNLDSSQQRFREISNLLGDSPRYTPRRRQDVDGVFIAAFPEQARLLNPQLKYHHAQDLPVMATSHIYSGTPNPGADHDLNGTIFVDAPWMVDATSAIPKGLDRQKLKDHWQQLIESKSRLMALGIDAYRLIPYLEVMRKHPDERLDGLTGQLHINNENRIIRELISARFVNGRPEFDMPTKDRLDEKITTTQAPTARYPDQDS